MITFSVNQDDGDTAVRMLYIKRLYEVLEQNPSKNKVYLDNLGYLHEEKKIVKTKSGSRHETLGIQASDLEVFIGTNGSEVQVGRAIAFITACIKNDGMVTDKANFVYLDEPVEEFEETKEAYLITADTDMDEVHNKFKYTLSYKVDIMKKLAQLWEFMMLDQGVDITAVFRFIIIPNEYDLENSKKRSCKDYPLTLNQRRTVERVRTAICDKATQEKYFAKHHADLYQDFMDIISDIDVIVGELNNREEMKKWLNIY